MIKDKIANTFRNLSNYFEPNQYLITVEGSEVSDMFIKKCIELSDPLSEVQKTALEEVIQNFYPQAKPVSKKQFHRLLDEKLDEEILWYVIKKQNRDMYFERTKGIVRVFRMNKAEACHGSSARFGVHYLDITNREIYELYNLSLKLIEVSNQRNPFLDYSNKVDHLRELLPSQPRGISFKYFKTFKEYLTLRGIIDDCELPSKVQHLK